MRRTTPHAFFWLLAGALAIAIVAAALAPDRAPAVALYWNPIYRVEVALVVLALVYLLGAAGWMAWHGQAFRRIELPGGAARSRGSMIAMASAAQHDPLVSARAHLARSKALREKTEYHGKAIVEHLRRYAEQQREAARRGR